MIGVFDSGSGGLTVLKEVRVRLPKADILYFGDIKNAPYGTKTHNELVRLTKDAVELLQSMGAHHIVSACNSVSAALALSSPLPHLTEMTEPTAASFRGTPARIVLTATPATIDSQIYQRAFHEIDKEIATVAIPELAGAIEFGSSDAEIERIIRDAFATVDLSRYDTLILGCTHYPLVEYVFKYIFKYVPIEIIDPAVAVAKRVEERLAQSEEGGGTTRFLISRESALFRDRVAHLWSHVGTPRIEVIE
ncbi:hypothetical protein COU19_00610 [Candidatus Kaiserbacteria bacterium CG10_big_fil_rev_8_21_14_0_10_56_12]|uniref:Uncharacterized protein n=1 Tax=Candidatus Kaiserbacteria bacterium CG10_big_fil_rev_8_21_14_0_10_56_12 TaxID=1974611 RepID=A0A2H0UAL5_9BACT|nr:MAG: hypothetical protein COU19_00610 [Candidatus Kaiserbacteria bacterium CG10_big_fil_rev_8_21_14_0_10_56_12]